MLSCVLPALSRCWLGSVQCPALWCRQPAPGHCGLSKADRRGTEEGGRAAGGLLQRSAGKRDGLQRSDGQRELRQKSCAVPQPLPRLRFPSPCCSGLRLGRPLRSGARRGAPRGLRRPSAARVAPASATRRRAPPAVEPRSGSSGWAPRARRSCAPAGGGAWRGCAARAVVGRCGSDGQIFSPAAPWCAAAFPGAGGSGRDPRGASPGATGCRRTGGTGGSRTCWRSNAGCTPCRRCACRGVRGRRRPSGPGRWGTAPRGPPAAMPTPPASCWQPPRGSWLRLPWLQSRVDLLEAASCRAVSSLRASTRSPLAELCCHTHWQGLSGSCSHRKTFAPRESPARLSAGWARWGWVGTRPTVRSRGDCDSPVPSRSTRIGGRLLPRGYCVRIWGICLPERTQGLSLGRFPKQ